MLDLAPRPAAAAPLRRMLAHARIEVALTLRNGEQLLLALVIPMAALIAGRLAGGRVGLDPETIVPSVFGLALFSTSFTSLAIMTAFERRYGVLERLAATPLGKGGLLAGKALAVGCIAGAQVVVLALTAMLLGWQAHLRPAATLAAFTAAGLALLCFASIGLLLAARARAEATLGLANLIYLAGMAAGLVLPVGAFPAPAQPWLELLPTAALGETLRAWSAGVVLPYPLLVLAAWAAVAAALARKGFRWTS